MAAHPAMHLNQSLLNPTHAAALLPMSFLEQTRPILIPVSTRPDGW